MNIHRITREPYAQQGFSERLVLNMITISLWPLSTDNRIGMLISALALEMMDTMETEDQIDAVIDQLRLQMKLQLHQR